MRRLVLPTLAIATGMLLAGAPLMSSAADYRSRDRTPTSESGTGPTESNYSGMMPSAQTERHIDSNTSRIEFSDQAETGYPGTSPTGRLDTWSSGPVKTNMTLIERVRQRIEQALPDADISAMANADEGVVTLMGLVATKEEKERAHKLVAHTQGVTEVHDELQVSG